MSPDTGTRVDWAVRVIPLPKEMAITGEVRVAARHLGLIAPGSDAPEAAAAREMLASLARGGDGAPFRIRLALAGDRRQVPPAARDRLRGAPNAEQAYAILGTAVEDRGEWLLAAITPLGLLYAARTLQQLLCPPPAMTANTTLTLPLGEIFDWPDIGERGQWGGNAEDDFAWMAAVKLNVVEAHCGAGVDERGQPTIALSPELVAQGRAQGIKVVPILTHLEQLAQEGLTGWEDCFNVPDEGRASRSDYVPGLCFSNPRTWRLIGEWLKRIAAVPGVRDIMVWLSEEATPCLCDRCRGKEPYALEVAAVVEGFRQAQRQVKPEIRLRLLTTQGSYPVNEAILDAAPEDVGVSYYDGGRTYDSSHAPMIYPLLEAFARRGRWLGVYPQLTHSWRTVFPWTGPQFARFRMEEFARKGLANVIGYVVPSNRFHGFNVSAAAEWSWNAAGRSPREFARAYAHASGIADLDGFAEWAETIGPVGWDLAASRLFLRMIYDPAMGMGAAVPLDHRFEGGPEVFSEEEIARDLAQARSALALARRLDLPDAVDESEICIASLKLLRTLYRLSHFPGAQAVPPAEVAGYAALLEAFDLCAAAISTRLARWGRRVCARADITTPSRLNDTIQAVPRAAELAREIIGTPLGIPDPHPDYRCRELGRWSARDFASGPLQTLLYDATPLITAPGEYAVCLTFLDSACGLTPRWIAILQRTDERCRQHTSPDRLTRIGMWDPTGEAAVEIDALLPGARWRVEVEAEGLPADAPPERATCDGVVSIRRRWPDDAVGDSFFEA